MRSLERVHVFVIVPLFFLIASMFLPCLSTTGFSPLALYPPIRVDIQYWSYQQVDTSLGRSDVRMFQDFWFGVDWSYHGYWQKWLWMFAFQVLALTFMGLYLVKGDIRKCPILLAGAICSTAAIAVCTYLLRTKVNSPSLGLNSPSTTYGQGYFLTLISLALSLILIITDIAAHYINARARRARTCLQV